MCTCRLGIQMRAHRNTSLFFVQVSAWVLLGEWNHLELEWNHFVHVHLFCRSCAHGVWAHSWAVEESRLFVRKCTRFLFLGKCKKLDSEWKNFIHVQFFSRECAHGVAWGDSWRESFEEPHAFFSSVYARGVRKRRNFIHVHFFQENVHMYVGRKSFFFK